MIVNKYTNGGGGGYVLPTATDSRLGGIKVGSGLTIDSGGTLSTSGDTGVSDYNDLTGKPVVNGFELSGSTFPIWAGRDLKECFGLMDGQPYYGMPSYTGHKVIVPEGETQTGTKTGSTILVEYAVPFDEQTHYQDCGTITSDRNGTVRTISFRVEFNSAESENYWKFQYKNDTAETWTDFDTLTPNEMGWVQLYRNSWSSQQYASYARIHTDDSYMGRIVFDFVPDYTSNWDLGKYATWTLPQDAVYSEIVATGIRRTKWRSTKIYVKYDKNQNFIEGCFDTEKYYIFVTSAGTVTSCTLTDYEKLEGYQDISGYTTFYDSETKHKWGVGVLDGNGKVYSTANLIFYCDFNGGYQTTTPSLEGYVNVNVDGTMTTYHGKWQKQSYGSWQTLLWEPYSPVQASGVANIWKGTQAEYDAITAKSDTTLYVIVPAATGQPANEIWYTTDTGTTPLSQALQVAVSGFNPSLGNSIVSDTIVNGVGKMVFTNPVTAIPDQAFFEGTGGVLYEGYGDYYITLPEGVTSIGESAFYEAVISGISLPSTLVEIGQWGFYGVWTADGSITFEGTSTQWSDDITFGENWMGGETNLCEIYCADGNIVDYCS